MQPKLILKKKNQKKSTWARHKWRGPSILYMIANTRARCHGAGPAGRRSALERYLTMAATQRKGDLAYLLAAGQPSREPSSTDWWRSRTASACQGQPDGCEIVGRRCTFPLNCHWKGRRGADQLNIDLHQTDSFSSPTRCFWPV